MAELIKAQRKMGTKIMDGVFSQQVWATGAPQKKGWKQGSEMNLENEKKEVLLHNDNKLSDALSRIKTLEEEKVLLEDEVSYAKELNATLQEQIAELQTKLAKEPNAKKDKKKE